MPITSSADNNKTVRTRAQSVNDMQAFEEKLDLILSEISQVKSDGASLKSDVNSIKNDNKQFKADITKTMDMFAEQLNDLKSSMGETASKVIDQGNDIDVLKSENISLKSKVSDLQRKLNACAQYSRSNCLDIQGVPESRSENVLQLVTKVAQVLGFKLEPFMIDAVHRLAPIPGRSGPRNIIVKFCRRVDMEEMRRLAIKRGGFSASNLGFSSELKVYVNLSMTRETRLLWADTRKLRDDGQYKYAWITSSGKIFLRKKDGDPPKLIEGHKDLYQLGFQPQTGPEKNKKKNTVANTRNNSSKASSNNPDDSAHSMG